MDQIETWWIADQIEAVAASQKVPVAHLSLDAVFDLSPEPAFVSASHPQDEEARILAAYTEICEARPDMDIADAYELAKSLVKTQ